MANEAVEILGEVLGGMDGSLGPSILPLNKFAKGINLSVRGGFARTRPALLEQSVSGMPAPTALDLELNTVPDELDVSARTLILTLESTLSGAVVGGSVRITKSDGTIFDATITAIDEAPKYEFSWAAGIDNAPTVYTDFTVEDSSLVANPAFQGAGVWSLESGDRFVFVVAGHVYSLEIGTLVVTQITGTDPWTDPVFDTEAQCYLCQADRYMVVQDGTSDPVVVMDEDGTPRQFLYTEDASYGSEDHARYLSGSDADFVFGSNLAGYEGYPPQGVPTGTVMAYVMGRLHVVPRYVPGGTETGRPYFLSGDIVKPSDPEDCLRFKETQYLTGGGAHGMPVEMGFIHGMFMMRNSEAGTGVGDLYALGRNGLSAFAVSLSRDQWTDSNIAQGLFVGSGTKSPWSIVQANNEVLFRGTDGIRSISYTTSAQWRSGSLLNLPLSTEVAEYMQDADYLPHVSASFFDNHYLISCAGVHDRYFQGLLHMDQATVVNLGSPASSPAYTGVWTGDDFAQVLCARKDDVPRGFIFAAGPKLYLIDDAVDQDNAAVSIESRIETRAYNFQDPVARKVLQKVDLWVSDVTQDTTITVYVRPDGYPYWAPVSTKTILVGSGSASQIRRKLHFGLDSNADYCDPVSCRPLHNASELQFAIAWTGHMQLDRAIFVADVIGEAPSDPCSETSAVVIEPSSTAGVELEDFTYRIDGSE